MCASSVTYTVLAHQRCTVSRGASWTGPTCHENKNPVLLSSCTSQWFSLMPILQRQRSDDGPSKRYIAPDFYASQKDNFHSLSPTVTFH